MNRFSLVVAACALCSTASAQNLVYPSASPSPLKQGAAPMAADQKLGMAILSAAVNAAGTLVHGAGVISVTNSTTGRYLLLMERPVRDCVVSVTSATTAGGISITTGFAFVGFTTPNEIEVGLVKPSTEAGMNADFRLLVFCPR